jgi:hypothetical protein
VTYASVAFFLGACTHAQEKNTRQTSDNGQFADSFCANHGPFLTQKGQETALYQWKSVELCQNDQKKA